MLCTPVNLAWQKALLAADQLKKENGYEAQNWIFLKMAEEASQ